MPKDQEEKFINYDFEVSTPSEPEPVHLPPILAQRLKHAHAVENQIPENNLSIAPVKPIRSKV